MRLRPPFKYHGGKFYLSQWIISFFPEHTTYLELFGGSGSVLLNKTPSTTEIYNDLDYNISNLMNIVKTQGLDLQKLLLDKYPYDEAKFYTDKALFLSSEYAGMPKLEQAALTYSLIRQSRGGTLSGFSKSKRLRGEGKAVPAEKLTYDNAIPKLPSVANRLKDVDILNEDAIPLIEKHNDPQCLFYLDPPYHADTRTAKDVYGQEMSSKQHEILLDVCLKSQSKIIISGYPSELYAKVLTNWNLKTQQIVNHASHKGKKAKMTECLWMNF